MDGGERRSPADRPSGIWACAPLGQSEDIMTQLTIHFDAENDLYCAGYESDEAEACLAGVGR